MQPRQKSNQNINDQEIEINIKNIMQCLINGEMPSTSNDIMVHFWTSLKIMIGNLIVRGYRMFKFMLEQQCIIFIKRQTYHTHYLYFKIAPQTKQQLALNYIYAFKYCIDQINRFRKNYNQNYTILVFFALNYNWMEIRNCQSLNNIFSENRTFKKDQLKDIIGKDHFLFKSFIPENKQNQSTIIGESQSEKSKLKQIVYNYVDTFGSKDKTKYYQNLQTKSLHIINTINLIIYQETKPIKSVADYSPLFNQIQSGSWTLFKGRMQSDRKDIILSGNGRILFIDLIFLQSLHQYIDSKYEEEVDQLVQECKKSYKEAKVKVIKLQNSLSRNVYSYQQKTVGYFSKLPIST